MNTRTLAFIVLSSLVLLTASILQSVYFPPVKKNQADPQAVEKLADGESNDGTVENDGTADAESPTKNDAEDKPNEAASESKPTESLSDNPQIDDNAKISDEDVEKAPSDDSELVIKPAVAASRLISLGSLDPTSGYRYLVTMDSAGGSIKRIELNTKLKSGRYQYRDLENTSGYLGELDCTDSARGCVVGVSGTGTPANLAGIVAGDVIRSVQGTEISSVKEFDELMAKTKPGDTIELGIQNAQQEYSPVDILLTGKPLEIIRPEPNVVDPEFVSPRSFLMSLRKRTTDENNWPEIDPTMKTIAWNIDKESKDSITFSHTVSNADLERRGLKGPVKVIKHFSLPKFTEAETSAADAQTFHLNFEFAIENPTGQTGQLAYELSGPTGTPSEGWWYQNKIHGRQSAVGSIAGSRDVVSSSPVNPFNFKGGPEIVKNQTKSQAARKRMDLFIAYKTPEHQTVNYLSVDTQYFNVSLIPSGDTPYICHNAFAVTTGQQIPKAARLQRLVDCTFRLFADLPEDSGTVHQSFEIFCGPKELDVLTAYGLEDARTFGWFAWFSKPLCWLLTVFYNMTFQIGYGIPIILLTLLVRSFMIPVSRKAALNAQMMQHLQPQIKLIADKYKDDMEKRASAQRALFAKYNYNPFGGCFMMFFQLPIFIGLYRGLSVDIALRDQPLIPGIQWCSNLSAPDQFLYWENWMPAFLASETGWLGPYLNILPLITIVLFLAQQKLFTPPPTDEQQEMAQKVMKFMMIFMGVMFFKVPAGLCLYFITSSMWGIIERKMLPKPKLNTENLPDFDDLEGQGTAKKKPGLLSLAKSAENGQSTSEKIEEKKRLDKERKKRLKQRGQ